MKLKSRHYSQCRRRLHRWPKITQPTNYPEQPTNNAESTYQLSVIHSVGFEPHAFAICLICEGGNFLYVSSRFLIVDGAPKACKVVILQAFGAPSTGFPILYLQGRATIFRFSRLEPRGFGFRLGPRQRKLCQIHLDEAPPQWIPLCFAMHHKSKGSPLPQPRGLDKLRKF